LGGEVVVMVELARSFMRTP